MVRGCSDRLLDLVDSRILVAGVVDRSLRRTVPVHLSVAETVEAVHDRQVARLVVVLQVRREVEGQHEVQQSRTVRACRAERLVVMADRDPVRQSRSRPHTADERLVVRRLIRKGKHQ